MKSEPPSFPQPTAPPPAPVASHPLAANPTLVASHRLTSAPRLVTPAAEWAAVPSVLMANMMMITFDNYADVHIRDVMARKLNDSLKKLDDEPYSPARVVRIKPIMHEWFQHAKETLQLQTYVEGSSHGMITVCSNAVPLLDQLVGTAWRDVREFLRHEPGPENCPDDEQHRECAHVKKLEVLKASSRFDRSLLRLDVTIVVRQLGLFEPMQEKNEI